MKQYESPFCEVDVIMQEKAILSTTTTASAGDDYSVITVQPFHSRSNGLWEEDDYE
ncbi:MAG: hypothetical protein IKG84_11230 [Bacteroidales bacterium]|nr:hypothetical protein [Bacteroidales bacterium]